MALVRPRISLPLRLQPFLLSPNTRKLIPVHSMSTSSSSQAIVDQEEDEEKKASLAQVLKYHEQTKNSFANWLRWSVDIDWDRQPNPFRRYVSSSKLISLLHPPYSDESPLYSSVFKTLPFPKPISHSTISQLFYHSLALSAWRSWGIFSIRSLRVNPSIGNLYPTEAYIVCPPIESVSDKSFVAHYAPEEHSLEIRAKFSSGIFKRFFPENSFLIGLSSIIWRQAWKHAERAFRYCIHDVGHAIAAVSMAAAGLGWDVKVLDGLGYEELEKLTGLEKFPKFKIPSQPVKAMPEIEFEHPDCVLLVFPSGLSEFEVDYKELSCAISEFSGLKWKGKPNKLSKEHICWDIIYTTAEAAKKPLTKSNSSIVDPFQSSGTFNENSYKDLSLREVVRKRRSAYTMDASTTMSKETFYQILLHCMPSGSRDGEKHVRPLALPFRSLAWDSEVHAALFVHEVVGLPNGLYFLVRNENHLDDLKKATKVEFKWVKPDGCPDDLPLYELAKGDCRELSYRLSFTPDTA